MRRRVLDRLVVAWCRLSRSHFIEPWFWYVMSNHPLPTEQRGHHGCEACTWCVECGRLLGREAIAEEI